MLFCKIITAHCSFMQFEWAEEVSFRAAWGLEGLWFTV